MSTEVTISVCANCGKEGGDVNNTCNKCNSVKYCNAACKKKHRHKHKKDCEEYVRLAAEHAAKLHDEKLFQQPPPIDDCPICFLLLPLSIPTGTKYQACCGKVIYSGCIHAPVYDNQGNEVDNQKCPFCRTPTPYTQEEAVERDKKRADLDDPIAILNMGHYYFKGINGYPQDYDKALELFHRSAELGCVRAYSSIGYAYEVVEVDKKKADHYYELGAMAGNVLARYNLGANDENVGNFDRAVKHYMIAARNGLSKSLEIIQKMYLRGNATKEDYTKALKYYQAYLGEIKSSQRDEAAAAFEKYKYLE